MITTPNLLPERLAALAVEQLFVSLLIVAEHRTAAPTVFDIPISADLAGQLRTICTETISAAADSELRPTQPGFRPASQQWLWTPRPDGLLADLDARVCGLPALPYERGRRFGRGNLLVLRLRRLDGSDAARLYQGFSPEKALQRGKVVSWWTGERFDSTDAEPLVIDRSLRLLVLDDVVVMQSAGAYEALLGPLPDLRHEASATYQATLGKLEIVNGDELEQACASDLNMMRKLMSIKSKLGRPGYVTSIEMPRIAAFLEAHPTVDVELDRSGPEPRLVHGTGPQRRWALLKLLDDDYLRSDLTNINYEANSKIEI